MTKEFISEKLFKLSALNAKEVRRFFDDPDHFEQRHVDVSNEYLERRYSLEHQTLVSTFRGVDLASLYSDMLFNMSEENISWIADQFLHNMKKSHVRAELTCRFDTFFLSDEEQSHLLDGCVGVVYDGTKFVPTNDYKIVFDWNKQYRSVRAITAYPILPRD